MIALCKSFLMNTNISGFSFFQTFLQSYALNKNSLRMEMVNSCTKGVGHLRIISDRSPNCHPVFWAWMTPQLNVALICKLSGSLMCLTYFFDMLSMIYGIIILWLMRNRVKRKVSRTIFNPCQKWF